MFDAGKTRMIGLPYKNYDNMLSRFHIRERHGRTYRRTDGQTDGQNSYINISQSVERLTGHGS